MVPVMSGMDTTASGMITKPTAPATVLYEIPSIMVRRSIAVMWFLP
jgi:hypothetical protein